MTLVLPTKLDWLREGWLCVIRFLWKISDAQSEHMWTSLEPYSLTTVLHSSQSLSDQCICVLCFHQDYFGVCSEPVIKDNVVVVYEVLEEMLDNGFPLATESNILKELIKPPTILRTVVNTITGTETGPEEDFGHPGCDRGRCCALF